MRWTTTRLSGIAMAFSSSSSAAILPSPRVLSIQSHVVHGCVGNRAASFPLQLLGVETDVLNTVQYSNHVGYGSFAGEKLNGEQLWALLQGMHANGLLSPARLLTGYMGSTEAVRAVVRALPLLREANAGFQYWCDPVLGDNGRLYVPAALVDVYRDEVVPFAYALLPNQFEAELLTGITINTVHDARRACGALHARGVSVVMITSSQLREADDEQKSSLTVLLSRRAHGSKWRREYRLDVTQLPHHFAGTGDLLAALLLGWEMQPDIPIHVALQRALAGVQSVLHRTVAESSQTRQGENDALKRPLGLRLLSSIDAIRSPDVSIIPSAQRLDTSLRGVLFDMDGTLALPGQLDFARKEAGLPDSVGIADLTDSAPQAASSAIEDLKMQPGLADLINKLKKCGIRVGIATRSQDRSVERLLSAASLPADTFDPRLTRETGSDPSMALAACKTWNLPTAACLMVGDSDDMMMCGRAAGMMTCYIQRNAPTTITVAADMIIHRLDELTAMIDDAVSVD